MSIPSSPPPLPEDVFNEPPSSPPLPPVLYPANRKRHADYESSLSSDPIFSEDASEDSDRNAGIKKKKYTKGPWYRHAPLPFQRAVASGSRNEDSGVWMGSDSSTDSIAGCDKRVQTLSFHDYTVKRAPASATPSKTTPSKAKSPHDVAAELVFRSVDACRETIDLSEMRLRTIPNAVLRPLHQLIRVPVDMEDDRMITPEHYAPLTPEIKLFLAKNELVELPSELWNLGNLSVLSVRNNDLTELPPTISRLRNLQELNIASNRFRWLPWELLDLMLPDDRKLMRISLSPNPFVQPTVSRPSPILSRFRTPSSARDCLKDILKIRTRFPLATTSTSAYEALLLRLHESRLHRAVRHAQAADPDITLAACAHVPDSDLRPVYVASSKTTFLDFDGSVLRSPMSNFSPMSDRETTASLAVTPLPSGHTSSAPSLFEISARACARSPYINQLFALLPEDASPPVTNALDRVIRSKDVGLPKCSVCRKQYVIPRAQWIEFWFDGHGSGEQFLPFIRRTCSWKCVQTLSYQRSEELADIKEVVAQVEASFQDLGENTIGI